MVNPRSPRSPVEELAEEFRARLRRGESPDLTEYITRYPELAEQIRDLFPALVGIEQPKPARGDVTGSFAGHEVVADALSLERLGDYRILRVIGRGGMGIVYEAEQVSLGRHVALKVLPSHALLDPRHLARFQREARAAGRLHHSNIVPVYGVGQENGLHYYVMQYIRGHGLDQVLTEVARLRPPTSGAAPVAAAAAPAGPVAQALLTGALGQPVRDPFETSEGSLPPLSEERPTDPAADRPPPAAPTPATRSGAGRPYWQSVARIGLQVAEALAYANSQGILHRDIKPSNLLLDLKGTVWVTDFGLAKAASDENVTHTGDIVGTLRYMAPERFNGPGDARSDLYALGLTLYEMLALRPAFEETDRSRLLQQVLHEEPTPPRKLNPAVPRDLETIVLKAIAREPAHRYQTAAGLADDLRRFLEDKPIQARRVSAPEALWRWCRRNRALAALTATVAGLLVAVAVGATVAAVYYLRVADREERLRNQAEQTAQREQQLKTEAEDARSHAEASAAESRQRLVQQYVDKGIELVDAGDAFTALPWLVEALRLDPACAEVHRTRLAAVLRQCPALVQVLRHPGAISTAAYSPDGRLVATAGFEGTAQVWEADTGRRVSGPLRQEGSVSALAFSPDGRRLVTGGGDWFGGRGKGEVRVWDVATGRLLAGPPAHERGVSAVAFSPDGRRLLTSGWDGKARVWDADTGRPVGPLLKHPAGVKRATFSPDGQRVVTAGWDGVTRVWDPVTGRRLLAVHVTRLGPVSGPMFDAAFSPDGRWVATAGGDRDARIWSATTGESRGQPMSLNESVIALAFSPDGRSLATAGYEGTARVWDAASGEHRTPPLRHAGWVTAVAFSPDSRCLLTGSWDGTARLWDAATGEPLSPPLKHSSYVWAASFSPDGRHVLTASQDGVARLWDVVPRERGLSRAGRLPAVSAFSPQGDRALSAEAVPRVWDLTTATPRAPLRGLRGRPEDAWFSRDGRRVLTAVHRSTNAAGVVKGVRDRMAQGAVLSALGGALTRWGETEFRVWDAETGRPLGQLRQVNLPYHAEFSSDGGRVVVVTGLFPGVPGGWEVRVWDVATGQPVAGPLPHPNLVRHAAFSPDGRRLVTAGMDGVARLWDVATGQEIAPGIRQPGPLMGAVFSPDGGRLLVTSTGGGVQLLDVATGRAAVPPLEHLGVVSHAAFSADGTRVVTTGGDGAARVWDAATGEPLTPPLLHGEALLGAAFRPDGRRLVTVGKETTARVWDVVTGQPLTPRMPLNDARLRRALTLSRSGPPRRFALTWEQAVRLWDLDLATDGHPPDDLVLQAHLLASHALDAHGGLTPLKGDALRQAWEELRARHPSPPAPSAAEVLAWHRRSADACVKGRSWHGALMHLDRLTEAEPKSPGNWLDRGRAHAELEQWDQAAADYERAMAAGAAGEPVWRELALLQLACGQPAGYRQACAHLLDHFGQTNDPNTANNLAWACILGPDATANPEEIVHLAERAVRANRTWVTLNTLGAALYRAGRLDEAVQRLTEADSRHEKQGSALDQVFLALAHHGRGDDARARACLAAADRLWKDESQASLASPAWVVRLDFQLLRREAEAQLNREGKPQPGTSAGEKDAHGR
jgi:WD40 repeat protein